MRWFVLAIFSILLLPGIFIFNVKESLADSQIGSGPLTLSKEAAGGFEQYVRLLGEKKHFAFTPDGRYAHWFFCGPHEHRCKGTRSNALRECSRKGGVQCKLFAEGNKIVWQGSNSQPLTFADVSPKVEIAAPQFGKSIVPIVNTSSILPPQKKATSAFPLNPIAIRYSLLTQRPDDIAVIIGNANYKKQGRDIPNVTPAYADAEASLIDLNGYSLKNPISKLEQVTGKVGDRCARSLFFWI